MAFTDDFKGLPMEDLIGGPLSAACTAQLKLARATAEFINTVGFVPADPAKPTENLLPRNVNFSFFRPVQVPGTVAAGGNGPVPPEIKVEKVDLSVPFLAIVNVPALCIKNVDITFDMEVKTSESSKDSTDAEGGFDAQVKIGWGVFSATVNLHGKVATHKENTRSTDKSAKYHVEVQARDDGMPEGLSRVLDILQSSIAPIQVGAKQTVSDAKLLAKPGVGTALN